MKRGFHLRAPVISDLGQFGDLASSGDVDFNDTYWDDIVVPLTTTRIGANSKPDFDYDNIGYLFPQNDKTEILYLIVQLPHRWKEGTTLYPHVHWTQTNAAHVPVFKMDYKFYDNGETVPANWSTYTMNVKELAYTSGSCGQISSGSSGIAATGKTISAMLLVKLYREDNAVTGDVLAQQFDIHFEINSPGSREQYAK